MANNVAVTEGSGKTIATTDVGGFQIQKIHVSNAAGTVVDPVAAGSAAMAAAVPVTIATDDTQHAAMLAAMGGRSVQVVPTCDATPLAQYDVMAATEVFTNATRAADINGILSALKVVRLDAATCPYLRIWLLSKNSSIGAENAAFAPADADADDLLGYVDFLAASFIGTTGMVNCFQQQLNINLPVKPAAGTRDVYFGIQVMDAAGADLGAATDIIITAEFI